MSLHLLDQLSLKGMGKGRGQIPLPWSSLQQLLSQFPHSQAGLEEGFGRDWLVLWCVHGEVILYFPISQVTGMLGEGPKALANIQGAAHVL